MNNINQYNRTYKKLKSKLIDLHEEHDDIEKAFRGDFNDNFSTNKDKNGKYNQFYGYCKLQLLEICNDANNLLDYLVYIYYVDKDFIEYHKNILWNCFGEEIKNRLEGNFEVKAFDASVIKKRAEKAKNAMKKKKAEMNIVYISQFDEDVIAKKLKKKEAERLKKMEKAIAEGKKSRKPRQVKIDNVPLESIYIAKDEIEFIKKQLRGDYKAKCLLFTLLVLYRKNNCNPIDVEANGKNKINRSTISKLAGFSRTDQYDKPFRLLLDKELITLPDGDKTQLLKHKLDINVPMPASYSDDDIKIGDVKDCTVEIKKIFRKS